MLYKASAPGSLMLFGEYAVLYHHIALVAAIDKRIFVELIPRQDKKIIIESTLGIYVTDIADLHPVPPFTFVLASLKKFQKKLKHGCTLKISSEFSATQGLGSSAAVTVASLTAILAWLGLRYHDLYKIRLARHIIQSVQGMGSGADAAASVLGGVVEYHMQPLRAKRIADHCPLTVVFSGSKTPTREAVALVQQHFLPWPRLFKHLLQNIGLCAKAARDAMLCQDWVSVGRLMNLQQGYMVALGVNTPALQDVIEKLYQQEEILGAKISGSGLGDCAIGLGFAKNLSQLDVAVTPNGSFCEKN